MFQVMVNVILNLAGVGIAIVAIVLYSINMVNIRLWWMCRDPYSEYEYTTPTPSPHESIMKEKCLEGKELVLVSVKNVI